MTAALDPVDRLVLDELDAIDARTAGTRVLALDAPALESRADVAWRDVGGPGPLLPDAELLAGVDRVVMRLPSSLSALAEYADWVASWAAPEVHLVAGGRVKHMTPRMNEVLGHRFGTVSASLGRQKSRVLRASRPLSAGPDRHPWPRSRYDETLGLTVVSHGATFNTNGLDRGTRLLVRTCPALRGGDEPGQAVDLGCGSGIMAVLLARSGWHVLAVDQSRAAIASTMATANANGLAVETFLGDGAADWCDPDGVDLVVCNPPFHQGPAKDSGVAFGMFAAAGRTLRSNGELWCVYNSHLPYRRALQRLGRTTVAAQDREFTVTRTVRH